MKFQKSHVAWNKGKGWKWSAESKKKLSQAKKGKPHLHKPHPHTEESKHKLSMAHRGKPKPPRTEEQARRHSERMSGPNNPNYGKKFSETTKQRMRAAHAEAHNGRRRKKGRVSSWNKNKPLSPEHRKHISEARLGKPHPYK